MGLDESRLVLDWNRQGRDGGQPQHRRSELDDETLRDVVQSPSARSATPEPKREILHKLSQLGINAASACREPVRMSGELCIEPVLDLVEEISRCGKASQIVLGEQQVRAVCRDRGIAVPDEQ